jgi:flagellar biosynthesis/type III secretory pathway protein FliH
VVERGAKIPPRQAGGAMSTLIRSSDLAGGAKVRTLDPGQMRRREPTVDPELAALRIEVERLRENLAAQDAVIARHGGELKQSYDEGEAAGRKAGLKEADDGRAALSAQIAGAAERALEQFSEELASLERLAPLLAVEGIERMLDQSSGRAQFVREIIGRQIGDLQSQAVICVEVARTDFPDDADLPQLAQTHIRALEDLKSGACRIRLQLGSLEVGIDQQWSRLREVLTHMAGPRGAS